MDGSAELLQLAHLLRVGADAARDIARIRPHNATAIEHLADQAEGMATKLEAIAMWPDGATRDPT